MLVFYLIIVSVSCFAADVGQKVEAVEEYGNGRLPSHVARVSPELLLLAPKAVTMAATRREEALERCDGFRLPSHVACVSSGLLPATQEATTNEDVLGLLTALFSYMAPSEGPLYAALQKRWEHHQKTAPVIDFQDDTLRFESELSKLQTALIAGGGDVLYKMYNKRENFWLEFAHVFREQSVCNFSAVINVLQNVGAPEGFVVSICNQYREGIPFGDAKQGGVDLFRRQGDANASFLCKLLYGRQYASEMCQKVFQFCPNNTYTYFCYVVSLDNVDVWQLMDELLPLCESPVHPSLARALRRAQDLAVQQEIDFDKVLKHMHLIVTLKEQEVKDVLFDYLCVMLSSKLEIHNAQYVWQPHSNIINCTVEKMFQMLECLHDECKDKTDRVYRYIMQCLPGEGMPKGMDVAIEDLPAGSAYVKISSGHQALNYLAELIGVKAQYGPVAQMYVNRLHFLDKSIWWCWLYQKEFLPSGEGLFQGLSEAIWDGIHKNKPDFTEAYRVLQSFIRDKTMTEMRVLCELRNIVSYLIETGHGGQARKKLQESMKMHPLERERAVLEMLSDKR